MKVNKANNDTHTVHAKTFLGVLHVSMAVSADDGLGIEQCAPFVHPNLTAAVFNGHFR